MHPLVDGFIKGRAKLKKNIGEYFDNPEKPKKACFVGAMFYGMGGGKGDWTNIAGLIKRDWPQLHAWVIPPCGCDPEGGYISSILIHLNDVHPTKEWNDEKILTWFKSVIEANENMS